MLDQFLADPTKVGMVGVLAIAIAAFMRGWIVTGQHHAEVVARYERVIEGLTKEKDQFKDMVIKSAETADRALRVAQTNVQKTKG